MRVGRMHWCNNFNCISGHERLLMLPLVENITDYSRYIADPAQQNITLEMYEVPCRECYPDAHRKALDTINKQRDTELMNCSIAEPCYRPDCTGCNPRGYRPANMRFARYALSEIFKAKRQAYTGLWPYQSFPRDPRAPK